MAFTIHHENPDVMTQDNFLTDKECDHFIELARPRLERAQVSSNKAGEISAGIESTVMVGNMMILKNQLDVCNLVVNE